MATGDVSIRIRIRIIYFSSTNEIVNIRRQNITIMKYRMTIWNITILSTDFPWRLITRYRSSALVLVHNVKWERRGQLEYGRMAMFTSRGPISLDPGFLDWL